VVVIATPMIMLGAQPAQAIPADRSLENPPLLKLREKPMLRDNFLAVPSEGRPEKDYELNIVYTDGKLYNPATQRYDNVHLRSYVGTDVNPNAPYVSPTIEIDPGSTVRITLHNKLPYDPTCVKPPSNENQPHCFNGTNLHSHGLWISPAGNSDNMLLSINPGVSFQYEYNIPPDHPAGTFWYHTHRHGSTALQVSSGMAGALIVRGNRLPSETAHGDIDTLLKSQDDADIKERILVLQQIQYACLDSKNQIKVQKDINGNVVAWVCDPKDKGGIESYKNFGPPTWQESGRYTSINGQILPTFLAKAGEIERWRMIHAGVRNTISLEFRKRKDDAPNVNALRADDADSYIKEHCLGDPIPYYVIADDGLTRSAAWETSLTTLQPGYRSDALVVFPEAGSYCAIDTSAPASSSPSQNFESRQLLGIVDAAPGTAISDTRGYLRNQLVTAAEQNMPISVRSKVIADLNDGLKLSLFTPHPDIQDKEITGKQELAFFIDTARPNVTFEVSNALGQVFDSKPYDPNRIDRYLTLGGADEWTLKSYFVSHPFHVHVNPFQIVKILDPNGNDVSLPNAKDGSDPEYLGLKGVWKDTLWIKSLIPAKNYPAGLYTIVLRTRYQRYIGEYVLHCHILDHEDQGMMQNVSIVLPSGEKGNTANPY
jgi:FtsP/CotA-like multicopper oxidase with cupredoxin domain